MYVPHVAVFAAGEGGGGTGGLADGHAGAHDAEGGHGFVGGGDAAAGDEQVVEAFGGEAAVGDVVPVVVGGIEGVESEHGFVVFGGPEGAFFLFDAVGGAEMDRIHLSEGAVDVDPVGAACDAVVEFAAAVDVVAGEGIVAFDLAAFADADLGGRGADVAVLETGDFGAEKGGEVPCVAADVEFGAG